jgi:anti-sigma regulatory factor (Ser/Thr protein kinase)
MDTSSTEAAPPRPMHCEGFARRMHPGVIRKAARHYLTDHKLDPEVIDSSVLVLSELVTNAVQHTRSLRWPWITVEVTLTPQVVVIEVTDPCPRRPITRRPSRHAPNGRGLIIVGELASWGYHWLHGGGKRVTAQVSRLASGSGDGD